MGRIILRLDRVMADRKIGLNELAGRISAIRFSTLIAICEALDCQPGDILEYARDEEPPVIESGERE